MISGWADLSHAAAGSRPQLWRERDRQRVELPGLCVEASGRGVDLYADAERIVVCCGDPRFEDSALDDVRAKRGVAAAWGELLARQGARAPASARGSYAVAAIELRSSRAILATDRFSVHPLCYAREGSRLAFADRADGVPLTRPAELDPQAIYDYLYFHVIPAPRTVLRGVERLQAAHTLLATAESTHKSAHWIPKFVENGMPPVAAAGRELRERLRNAVALEADTPAVGCFLSGGTDSSTVAGLLGEVTGGRARTFSIGFDAEGYDEMTYVRVTAAHFKTDHHEHYLTPEDLLRSIPEVAAHYDQPFGNSSALPAYYCARMARAEGVEKLLAGDGGDELFGGNTRYAKQKVFAAYARVPEGVRTRVIEPLLLGLPGVEALPGLRKAASYVRQARVPLPDRLSIYNLLVRLGVTEVLEPEFLRKVDPEEPITREREIYRQANCASLVNRMLAYDWKYTLADNDLPKVCGSAALAGVRVGFPFLADEVVDFSLELPASYKVRGLKLRYFFKEAMRGFLPDATIAKPKHGFGLPFGVWLTRHEGLRDLALSSLARLATHGIVRRPFLETLVESKVAEHPAFYGEMVWILMMLEHWLAARARKAPVAGLSPGVTTA